MVEHRVQAVQVVLQASHLPRGALQEQSAERSVLANVIAFGRGNEVQRVRQRPTKQDALR